MSNSGWEPGSRFEAASNYLKTVDVYSKERTAINELLGNIRDGNGYGGLSWVDVAELTKAIEDMIDAKLNNNIRLSDVVFGGNH